MSLLEDLKAQLKDAEQLIDDLSARRKLLIADEHAVWRHVDDLHRAIAALEPAPDAQAPVDEPEIPEGFTKWEGGLERPMPIGTPIEVFYRDGTIQSCLAGDEWSEFWWTSKTLIDHPSDRDIIAYRILSQPEAQPADRSKPEAWVSSVPDMTRTPTNSSYRMTSTADQSEEAPACTCHPDDAPLECQHLYAASACRAAYDATLPTEMDVLGILADDETHTDDLRTAEGETAAGDDRIEIQSILDDPELIETAERLEATLAAAEPNYVGLQDAELDAEYDAMKEREKADKPKLHFSIFGERGNRKPEEV